MKFFWPDIDDTQSAHRACGSGAGAAFFIAVVTGLVAGLQASGKINIMPGIGLAAFIDAGLFFIIGVGLCFHSRIAAVSGLILYFIERVYMIKTYGFRGGQFIIVLLIALAFINAVRGSFAWHEFKKIEKGGTGEPSVPAPDDTVVPKRKKNLLWIVVLIFVVAFTAIVAIFFLIPNQKERKGPNAIDFFKQKAKQISNKVTPPPQGPTVHLKTNSGRSFEGILVKKNEEGYWVYLHGTGEVFFSVKETAEFKE